MTPRILVADDDEDVRTVVRLTLERAGVGKVVAEAADGEQAVRLAGERQPDVVLLDVTMPGVDGLAALELIRRELPATRVVVLSGHDEAAAADRALGAGASGYVVKGGGLEELVHAVQQALDAPAPDR